MRKRKEIEKWLDYDSTTFWPKQYSSLTKRIEKLKIELLLDIRELLISQKITAIPFLTSTQAIDELRDEIRGAIKK